jgi:trehalose-6-phosphate hydrolase
MLKNKGERMKNWWKEAVFYELYIPSFNDSNGDGKGDFKGIIEKLDYLKRLGITGIWLTPFYQSPKIDNGYDISDYYSVDSDYGTMADFEEFLSKDNPYRDYYIWKEKPNNWESFFSGSAWEWDRATNEYYYHKFAVEQVDLNWTNPKVRKEANKIMEFWLDKGIDGFRLDVINFMTCEGITEDNPMDEKGEQDHKFDIDQSGILDAIGGINKCVKSYGDKFLVGEIGSEDLDVLKKYCGEDLLDVVFNFNLGSKEKFDSKGFYDEIEKMDRDLNGYPTIFFGSHDMPRHMSRFGESDRDVDRAKAIATFILTTKGVPFLYYGDEIGMTNLTAKSMDEINDIQGRTNYETEIKKGRSHEEALKTANEKTRDKSRSPMQWNSTENSGFTTGTSWLKINGNYKFLNVENEKKNTDSLFNYYKKLIELRKGEEALSYGEYENLKYTDGLISFERVFKEERIYVYINFEQPTEIELPCGVFKVLAGEAKNTLVKNEILVLKKGRK